MANPLTQWIHRYPLLSFFLLAFLLTWANWVPRALISYRLIDATVPEFIALIAGYGPALAAILITLVISGRAGLCILGKRLIHWKVGVQWYLIVLLLPIFHALLGYALHLLFDGEALLLILMFTLGFDGLGEELGWRGFALPRLLHRYSALNASLILGAIWAVWHLPYALTQGTSMSDSPFYAYLPGMFASAILFTWIFNNTQGSVLISILFHAAGNVTVNILPDIIPGIYDTGIWGFIVPWLVVGVVIAVEGPQHLSRKQQVEIFRSNF